MGPWVDEPDGEMPDRRGGRASGAQLAIMLAGQRRVGRIMWLSEKT